MNDTELTGALVQVVIALLGLAAIAISGYLAPWLRRLVEARAAEARAAGHVREVDVLTTLAREAVLAIEQQVDRYVGNVEKRHGAIEWLLAQGIERGLTVSRQDAAQLIEAAVRAMKATGLDVAGSGDVLPLVEPLRLAGAVERRLPGNV